MARLIFWLQGLFQPLGMSGLGLDLAAGACLSALALSFMPAIGWLVGRIRQIIYKSLTWLCGEPAAFAIMNWLTFPGVAIHELSHAFIARLFGARIDEIKLFRPSGESLGYVRFTCMGKPCRIVLQAAASSCAPVFMGFIVIRLLFVLSSVLSGYWHVRVLAYHIAFSTACHMTMSAQDMRSYKRGCFRLFLILSLAGFILSYMAGKGTLA